LGDHDTVYLHTALLNHGVRLAAGGRALLLKVDVESDAIALFWRPVLEALLSSL
jgi:hypothetical protein